jgi:hypothetical protein
MKSAILTWLVWGIGVIHASEQVDRLELRNTAQELFQQQSYGALIQLMDIALLLEERTKSGVWKLGVYFQGIADLADLQTTDDDFWNQNKQSALEMTRQFPASPFGYLIQAEFLFQHARMYRHNGIYEVDMVAKKRVWPQYDGLLEETKKFLIEHKSLASKNPHWYVMMLNVATAQKWDQSQFQSLLDEATSAFPQYYPILFGGLRYWHQLEGQSSGMVEQYINQVVQLSHHSEGLGMYARLHWYIMPSCDCDRLPLHQQSSLDWSKMIQSIDHVLSQYPDQWNINHFAYFACLSGDPVATHRLIERVSLPPLYEVWQEDDFFQSCKDWAANSQLFLQP